MDFPQQQRAAGDGKVIYPPGVKEITDKISNDEVVKRLKVLDVLYRQVIVCVVFKAIIYYVTIEDFFFFDLSAY